MNMSRFCVAAVLSAWALVAPAASTNYWTGKAGPSADGYYYWTNTVNWSLGRYPDLNGHRDNVVFTNDADITISILGTESKSTYLEKFIGFASLSLKGDANVTLEGAGGTYIFPDSDARPCELFVAADRTLTVSGARFNAGYQGKNYKKTGDGAFVIKQFLDGSDGTLEVCAGSFASPSAGLNSLTVRTNATYHVTANLGINGSPKVQLDAGATILFDVDAGSLNLGSLNGAGSILYGTGAYLARVTIKPTEDCVFSGTFGPGIAPTISSSATGRFIVGASNVFEQVRLSYWNPNYYGLTGSKNMAFLPGVKGPFVFGEYKCDAGVPLNLADTNGNPVEVIATLSQYHGLSTFQVSGPGNFYSRKGSITLTGNQVQNTGTIGLLAGELALGDGTAANDLDLSTVTGLDARGGTIYVKNVAPVTISGTVGGAGTYDILPDMTVDAFYHAGTSKVRIRKDFTMKGGDLDGSLIEFFGSSFGASGQTFTHSGGKLTFKNTQLAPNEHATEASPTKFVFDGTTVDFAVNSGNFYPFADTAALKLAVTGKGVRFHSTVATRAGRFTANVHLYPEILSAAQAGERIPVRQDGMAMVTYYHALPEACSFTAEGSQTRISGTLTTRSDGSFLGAGPLTLRNHVLMIFSRPSGGTDLAIPGGLTAGGGAMLYLRSDASAPTPTVTLGALAFEPGGALSLYDKNRYPGADGAAVVKVTGGVPTSSTSGRVLAPVFATAATYDDYRFLGYDDEKGFVNLPNVVTETYISNADPTKVLRLLNNGGSYSPAGEQHYAAESISCDNFMVLTLAKDSTISVGNGTSPAMLLMSYWSMYRGSLAALDFGTSEAVIVTDAMVPESYQPAEISMPIRSANGVSIVSVPYDTMWRSMVLDAKNTYSGATRIGATCVRAKNDGCFSSGDVYISGGDRVAGQVRFEKAGGVWRNAFHLSGAGTIYESGYKSSGALTFCASGEVAGNVELVGSARVIATNGVGLLSGTLSGGKFEVVESDGLVKLSGSNVYTGGTYLAKGTLAVVKGDGVGTGSVVLNNGTLRFENTEPIVFTNDLTGVGTIVFAGTAPVTIRSSALASLPFSTFAAGTELNVADPSASTLVPFVSGTTDLGGASVTVAGLAGTGTIANGILTVTGTISPGGEGAVGTLSFERMPIFSGATYVCDAAADRADLLVLPDACDLATLGLTVIKDARPAWSSSTILSAAGGVSGSFATTTLPRKFAVETASQSVDLSYAGGLGIIVR